MKGRNDKRSANDTTVNNNNNNNNSRISIPPSVVTSEAVKQLCNWRVGVIHVILQLLLQVTRWIGISTCPYNFSKYKLTYISIRDATETNYWQLWQYGHFFAVLWWLVTSGFIKRQVPQLNWSFFTMQLVTCSHNTSSLWHDSHFFRIFSPFGFQCDELAKSFHPIPTPI